MQRAVTQDMLPQVVTNIVGALWAESDGGVYGGERLRLPDMRSTQGLESDRGGKRMGEKGDVAEFDFDGSEAGGCFHSSPKLQCRSDPLHLADPLATPQGLATVRVSRVSNNTDDSNIFVELKKEHNLAMAVKLDGAEVDVYSWDCRVCRGEPTEEQVKSLVKLREFGLWIYQKGMLREVRRYMAGKYGVMEHSRLMSTGRSRTREEWQEAHMEWISTNASGWLE